MRNRAFSKEKLTSYAKREKKFLKVKLTINEIFSMQTFYRLELKTKARKKYNEKKSSSSVSSAAYRHCCEMSFDNKKFDFKNKFKQLKYENILMPAGTENFFNSLTNDPKFQKLSEREKLIQKSNFLWSESEKMEKRVDARLYKELIISLPNNIDLNASKNALEQFLMQHVVSLGLVCDIAIHSDLEGKNPHAHVMLTQRKIENGKFAAKKERKWDKDEVLIKWREEWANTINLYLEERDQPACSHLSYEKQSKLAKEDGDIELSHAFFYANDSKTQHTPTAEFYKNKTQIKTERSKNRNFINEIWEIYERTRTKISSFSITGKIISNYKQPITFARSIYDELYNTVKRGFYQRDEQDNENSRRSSHTMGLSSENKQSIELHERMARSLEKDYQTTRNVDYGRILEEILEDKAREQLKLEVDNALELQNKQQKAKARFSM